MENVIHVGDIGTVFRLTIVENDGKTIVPLSNVTDKKILLKKPNGTKIEKNAEFFTDGEDGIIQYTSVEGDIDTAGVWFIQGWVSFSPHEFSSEKTKFRVFETLKT